MGKRLLQQRRGALKGISPSHRHRGEVSYPPIAGAQGTVVELMHAPGRTTPLARVALDGHGNVLMIAAEGLRVNQRIWVGKGARPEVGSVMALRHVPVGTQIFNIESRPGDGGRFARAAGQAAVLVTAGERPVVQLPSGQFKTFEPECRATIGRTAGSGHKAKPLYKAGQRHHMWKSTAKHWPKVRGVAKNPVDHPHGGGSHQHVGRPSTVAYTAPPGAKVGRLSPRPKRRGRR
jgi:large subunit ribosomal protein L2